MHSEPPSDRLVRPFSRRFFLKGTFVTLGAYVFTLPPDALRSVELGQVEAAVRQLSFSINTALPALLTLNGINTRDC